MGPQCPICPKQNIFGTNHYYYYFFDLTIGPFHLPKLKKKSYSGSRAMRMRQFWAQNGPFAQTDIFWKKIVKMIFIYLLVPFIMQNFKIILKADPELLWCTIFGPKMAHLPKWEFFCRKPVKNPCSFHSCLSICQKSKSDIKLLMKYWRLNDTLIVLDLFSAITWEPDFSKTCSFQRMLMNHTNFCFT